jgi:hypothetical protein
MNTFQKKKIQKINPMHFSLKSVNPSLFGKGRLFIFVAEGRKITFRFNEQDRIELSSFEYESTSTYFTLFGVSNNKMIHQLWRRFFGYHKNHELLQTLRLKYVAS